MNETPDSTSSVEREQTGEPQPLFIPSFSVGGRISNPPTSEIEKLLGQATPSLPLGVKGVNKTGHRVVDANGHFLLSVSDPKLAQLIVLAVNALPANLALQKAAQALMNELINGQNVPSLTAYQGIKSALSEVDSALKEVL